MISVRNNEQSKCMTFKISDRLQGFKKKILKYNFCNRLNHFITFGLTLLTLFYCLIICFVINQI